MVIQPTGLSPSSIHSSGGSDRHRPLLNATAPTQKIQLHSFINKPSRTRTNRALCTAARSNKHTCTHVKSAPVYSPTLWDCRQDRWRCKCFWEFPESFPTRLLKTCLSSSAQAELCAQFSMMRWPQRTDTTLFLSVTPCYSKCTTSFLRNPLLRLTTPRLTLPPITRSQHFNISKFFFSSSHIYKQLQQIQMKPQIW